MKVDKYKLSLQALEYLSKQDRVVLRQNIISEPSSGVGNFERHFNVTLTGAEKNRLALVLVDLQDRGLIEALFRDTMNAGNDLVITDKGRRALEKRVLDDLDELLRALNSDSDLIAKRYGAYDAVLNKQTDWQSQAANSLAELLDHTLRTIAPTDVVKTQSWYTESKAAGGIRKQKIRYFLEQNNSYRSKSQEDVIDEAWQLIESCRGKLQGIKHANENQDDIEQLIKLAEDALMYLLKQS